MHFQFGQSTPCTYIRSPVKQITKVCWCWVDRLRNHSVYICSGSEWCHTYVPLRNLIASNKLNFVKGQFGCIQGIVHMWLYPPHGDRKLSGGTYSTCMWTYVNMTAKLHSITHWYGILQLKWMWLRTDLAASCCTQLALITWTFGLVRCGNSIGRCTEDQHVNADRCVLCLYRTCVALYPGQVYNIKLRQWDLDQTECLNMIAVTCLHGQVYPHKVCAYSKV